MLFPLQNIEISQVQPPKRAPEGTRWDVARLDKLHPVISGNKIFKLIRFLEKAVQSGTSRIITYGGPYSNHLVATAYACRLAGLQSTGFVRGEEPAIFSETLKECRSYGMELRFINREQYRRESGLNPEITPEPGADEIIIPEGGFHPLGAEGAALIMSYLAEIKPTHIMLATGTATTLAGILQQVQEDIKVIAIPVLKNMLDIPARLEQLGTPAGRMPVIADKYHFGGYARYTSSLLAFMNQLYSESGIPTDFVYTGKMMFATYDLISQGYFPENSHILSLHTGGLQGNRSLPPGSLIF